VKLLVLHPLPVTFSYDANTIAQGGSGDAAVDRWLSQAPSVKSARVVLKQFVATDLVADVFSIKEGVAEHYRGEAADQVLPLLGSLAAIGAPAQMFGDVADGLRDVLSAPLGEGLEGARRGITKVIMSVAKSVSVAGSLFNDSLARAAEDDEFLKTRDVQVRGAAYQGAAYQEGQHTRGQHTRGGAASEAAYQGASSERNEQG
jgi:hypothetical protein